MKIIGKTKEGFIIEAHANEVARLIGFYSQHSMTKTFDHRVDPLPVGAEININGMYEQLRKIESIRSLMRGISENAQGLLTALVNADPIIKPIVDAVTESKPKE